MLCAFPVETSYSTQVKCVGVMSLRRRWAWGASVHVPLSPYLYETSCQAPRCAVSADKGFPVWASQTRTDLSAEVVTICLPSGLNRASDTVFAELSLVLVAAGC